MTLALLIALLLVGFVLIGIELFVTPGFVIGIIGMLFLAGGIWFSFEEYGSSTGGAILTSVLIILTAGIFFTLRSGFWQRLALQDQITGKANDYDKIDIKTGDEGVTLSALRPSGSAIFNGKRYEVYSDGEFIANEVPIRVVKIQENKIYIEQIPIN